MAKPPAAEGAASLSQLAAQQSLPGTPPRSTLSARRPVRAAVSTTAAATAATTDEGTPRAGVTARRGQLVTAEAASAGGCTEGLKGDAVGLGVTYWFDSRDDHTGPYSVAVRFVGRRVGAEGSRDPRDRFERIERVDGLPCGNGRVAVNTSVVGVNAGQWHVTAVPVDADLPAPAGARSPRRIRPRLPRRELTTRTRLAPLVHGPGVRQAAWPLLVLLGVAVALTTQALLLKRAGAEWRAGLVVSAVAVLVGYLTAKTWYLVLHRQHPRKFVSAGTCIQGFILGGFGTAAIALAATGIPVGTFLDATAPGLFFAIAIGRPGCFLGGCCAGRPTASRWGLWSSDRRVGVRRIPVQLMEAAMALALGFAVLALALAGPLPVPGALFVGGVATYTVGRQLLFPLRKEPRRTLAGRLVTLVASGLVAVAAVLVSAVAA